MAKLTSNSNQPLSQRFFNAQVKPNSMVRLIACIVAVIASIFVIVSSVMGSFSYVTLENGISTTGKVSGVESGTTIYPDFAPRSEFKNYSYETALVNYTVNNKNYFVSLAEPVIVGKVHNGETVKLLVDPDDNAQAIADVFPIQYNWIQLIIFTLIALAASIFGFREVAKMKAANLKRLKGQGKKKAKV